MMPPWLQILCTVILFYFFWNFWRRVMRDNEDQKGQQRERCTLWGKGESLRMIEKDRWWRQLKLRIGALTPWLAQLQKLKRKSAPTQSKQNTLPRQQQPQRFSIIAIKKISEQQTSSFTRILTLSSILAPVTTIATSTVTKNCLHLEPFISLSKSLF